MYTTKVIEVNNMRVDSYTAGSFHLHRDVVAMDGSWTLTKRNWLGQLTEVQARMNWSEARDLFNWHTNEYISDQW